MILPNICQCYEEDVKKNLNISEKAMDKRFAATLTSAASWAVRDVKRAGKCEITNMRFEISCLLIAHLAATTVIAAPNNRNVRDVTDIPSWYLPCGDVIEQGFDGDSQQELDSILSHLKLMHKITLEEYLYHDYEYLYNRVRIGVQEHQYIPNWLPGKKDSNYIKRLGKSSQQTIINHLPKLHMDLQKFAVAFEELVQDEPISKTHDALKATQSQILSMLCEVESTIADLPSLRLPQRIERSIMNQRERDPVDDTRRLVRDWGVLIKYKDYLHAWRRVFDY
ncbi:PREDICTED: uncharacterized protein LOC107073278 [Polistes dominula]|uniref:Uncharacterized protein LOC107073278 n=1 Tax=Polistes dominula TaxID=743375 RepID=A0ABM1JA65_POLDO|nr:PREDICTED: uncharacterized protein LOC107073278 [Polistes dominula]